MKRNPYFAIDYYNRHVIQMIIDKYGLDPMVAARRFLLSETHALLGDAEYGLLSMPERSVFEMWEAEQVTGDPRNAVAVRGE